MVQSSQVSPFPADEPRFERLNVFVRGLEVEAGIGVRCSTRVSSSGNVHG